MSIIVARCSFEESRKYKGSLTVPYEVTSPKSGKVLKKVHKVFLLPSYSPDDEIPLDDYLSQGVPSNVAGFTLDFTPSDRLITDSDSTSVPVFCLTESIDSLPAPLDGITYVLDVAKSPSLRDFRALVEVSRTRPDVRILPHSPLLTVEGLRIGYFDADYFNLKPLKSSVYDTDHRVSFTNLSEVEGLQETAPKSATRRTARLKDFSTASEPKHVSKPRPVKITHSAYLASKLGGAQLKF